MLSLLWLVPFAAPAADDVALFEKSIRPLLHQRCIACHSEKKQRGGLRLDSRAAVLQGGDTGPGAVPGDPTKSLLVQAVRQEHPTLAMPPEGKLPAREIALLEDWVRRGLPYPGPAVSAARTGVDFAAGRRFWSFQPLKTTAPPSVGDPWPRSRVDAFLVAAMRARGLSPAAEADRATLLRRVTFDLTGLPPTPTELEMFLADARPDAYERLVDRLLASPAHGERWGRLWLDLARYADVTEEWAGMKGFPHHYRDWVVRAFNEDLPYTRFVELQLAADLAGAAPADRAALGFLGLSPTYWKELKLDHLVIQGVIAEEWEERVHTLTSTFLGMTVACARCHDHKFDPVSTQDYYALAGVFASSRQADVNVGGALTPGVVEESVHVIPDGPNRTKLTHERRPYDVGVQVRGNPATVGPVVPRRFLTVLSAEPRPFRQGSGRQELAAAITGEASALAARVIVNRAWGWHFGAGLVRTPSDFGSQGERPTHPELLDDLAARFVASGWSLKWLHREIVLSAAYRQGSKVSDTRDPENRWLARMSKRRLDVEAWRDAMFSVSGSLDRRMGGPALPLDAPTNHRRTLYGVVKRRDLADVLRLHDFPDPVTHSAGRMVTTTPLQQLFALNSPLVRGRSQALARRLMSDAGNDPGRVDKAYRLLFGREPTAAERVLAAEYLKASPWEEYAQVLLTSNEFLFLE